MEQIKSEGEKVAKNENIFRYYSKNEENLKKQIAELDVKIQETMKKQTDLYPADVKLVENQIDEEIEKLIRISTNLNDDDIMKFHTKMWIFCHGIATLVANDTIKLTDSQIQELLSDEFQALMLLEKNPNNKGVLPKKEENK